MALILTRSPFHISRRDLKPNATLQVLVGVYEYGTVSQAVYTILSDYQLAFRNNRHIDISQIIHDTRDEIFTYSQSEGSYQKQDFSENSLVVQLTLEGVQEDETDDEIKTTYQETLHSLRGYVYTTDPQNYDATNDLEMNSYYAGSSDIVYKLDDSNLELPLVNPTSLVNPFIDLGSTVHCIVTAFYKGEIIDSQYLFFNGIDVYNQYSTNNFGSFTERVESQEGVIEQNKCLTDFFDCHRLVDVDKIHITSYDNSLNSTFQSRTKVIEVRTIEEKKHNPYRLSFRNRFGVWEHLWFFKKSIETLKVESSSFRQNQFYQRNAGNGTSGVGNLVRSEKVYNKNGRTELTLNSGFVDEALNESFKQLMLSEEVVLYNFRKGTSQAVTVKDSELKLKTSTNDKLINYTIEVEFSNNIIDNIV